MSNKIVFKLNPAGVRQLLNSPEVRNVLQGYASAKQAAAGEGYALRETHTDRVGFSLYPETAAARRDNLENNTLEKVIR